MTQLPKLYDQSSVLTNDTFQCRDATKKVAVILTKDALPLTTKIPTTIPSEHFLLPAAKEEIRHFVQSQTIGTHIFVMAPWDEASEVFDICIEEGMCIAEIQINILGVKKRYVYCMKCYNRKEVALDTTHTQCNCGAHLEIGPFFSALHQGYIGYPFQPSTKSKGADLYESSGSD